jgi:hypothetical protein
VDAGEQKAIQQWKDREESNAKSRQKHSQAAREATVARNKAIYLRRLIDFGSDLPEQHATVSYDRVMEKFVRGRRFEREEEIDMNEEEKQAFIMLTQAGFFEGRGDDAKYHETMHRKLPGKNTCLHDELSEILKQKPPTEPVFNPRADSDTMEAETQAMSCNYYDRNLDTDSEPGMKHGKGDAEAQSTSTRPPTVPSSGNLPGTSRSLWCLASPARLGATTWSSHAHQGTHRMSLSLAPEAAQEERLSPCVDTHACMDAHQGTPASLHSSQPWVSSHAQEDMHATSRLPASAAVIVNTHTSAASSRTEGPIFKHGLEALDKMATACRPERILPRTRTILPRTQTGSLQPRPSNWTHRTLWPLNRSAIHSMHNSSAQPCPSNWTHRRLRPLNQSAMHSMHNSSVQPCQSNSTHGRISAHHQSVMEPLYNGTQRSYHSNSTHEKSWSMHKYARQSLYTGTQQTAMSLHASSTCRDASIARTHQQKTSTTSSCTVQNNYILSTFRHASTSAVPSFRSSKNGTVFSSSPHRTTYYYLFLFLKSRCTSISPRTCYPPRHAQSQHETLRNAREGSLTQRNFHTSSQNTYKNTGQKSNKEHKHKPDIQSSSIKPLFSLTIRLSNIKPSSVQNTCWSKMKSPHMPATIYWSNIESMHTASIQWSGMKARSLCSSSGSRRHTDKTDKTVNQDKKQKQQHKHLDEASRHEQVCHTDKTDKTDKTVSKSDFKRQRDDDDDDDAFKREARRLFPPIQNESQAKQNIDMLQRLLQDSDTDSHSALDAFFDADAPKSKPKNDNLTHDDDDDDMDLSQEAMIQMLDQKIKEIEESEKRIRGEMKREDERKQNNKNKGDTQADDFLAGLEKISRGNFVGMSEEKVQSLMRDALRTQTQTLRAQHDGGCDDEEARPGWLRLRCTQSPKANADQKANNNRNGSNAHGKISLTQKQESEKNTDHLGNNSQGSNTDMASTQTQKTTVQKNDDISESELSVGWLRLKADHHVHDSGQTHGKVHEKSGQINQNLRSDGNSGSLEEDKGTLRDVHTHINSSSDAHQRQTDTGGRDKGTSGGVHVQTSSNAAHQRQTDTKDRGKGTSGSIHAQTSGSDAQTSGSDAHQRQTDTQGKDKGTQGGGHGQTQRQTDRHDTNAKEGDVHGKGRTERKKTSSGKEEEDMSWLTPELEAAARKVRFYTCMYVCT